MAESGRYTETKIDSAALHDIRVALITIAGIAVAASFVEAAILWRLKRVYDWREAAASLAVAGGRGFMDLLPLSIAFPMSFWLYEHRIWTPTLNSVWGLGLLFVGVEFFYYWFHRASHRVRWFWATHAVHHSPNSLNFSAAYRLGWTSRIGGSLLFFLPLAWLGYPPRVIAAAFIINLLYQFWIHAEWIPKLGPLEGILNTPSAHRVHHAANLEYLDGNYGGVLMIFDRLFGTYIPERTDVPCRYGLVAPLRSYNPFRIAFFYWIEIFRDLRGARSLRDVAGFLFGPPGWAPDGNGPTTENLRRRALITLAAALVAGCQLGNPEASAISRERIAEIVASPDRSPADRINDQRRKPELMLGFIGVRPGMLAMDLSAGGGYTTELLARAVGPAGKVYGQSPPPAANRPKPAAPEGEAPPSAPAPRLTSAQRLAERAKNPNAGNIIAVVRPFEDPAPPELAAGSLDLVTLMFNYHDLGYLGVDRAQMNRAVFAALKPGGLYVIADHSGRAGTGISEGGTLHRVEEALVRGEIESAGFKLAEEGSFLRNPNDPRDRNTPEPPMPKDEFVLKFVKPPR